MDASEYSRRKEIYATWMETFENKLISGVSPQLVQTLHEIAIPLTKHPAQNELA